MTTCTSEDTLTRNPRGSQQELPDLNLAAVDTPAVNALHVLIGEDMSQQNGNVRAPPTEVRDISRVDIGQISLVERLVVEFTHDERSIIPAHRDAARNVTVVGQVVGRSPILRDINSWAKETLHSTYLA